MLKSLTRDEPTSRSSDATTKDQTLRALQKQLNDLKMKVLKVSRMSRGEKQGLIDSGVTHPCRLVRGDEDFKTMKDLVVTLASGER